MGFSRSNRTESDSVEQALGLERKFAAVAHGDCYRAIQKDGDQTVVVWVTRQPLDQAQRRDFLKYTRSLEQVFLTRIKEYGVDGSQKGFVSVCVDSTTALDSDKPSAKQVRKRFIECLVLVDTLHQAGLECGNLAEGSFVLTSRREVEFIGVLGGFTLGKDDSRPLVTLPYQVPQSQGEALRPLASDVYALSVLGLRLYGAQFPPSGISPDRMPDYLERVTPDAPRWVSRVLVDIVRNPRQKAYRNAGDLLAGLAASERSPAFIENRDERAGRKSGPTDDIENMSVLEIANRARNREKMLRGSSLQQLVHSSTAKVVFVGLLIFLLVRLDIISVTQVRSLFSMQKSSAGSTKPMRDPSIDPQRPRAIAKESFAKLLELVESPSDDAEYTNSWNAILQSAHKAGLRNSARFIRSAATRGLKPDEEKPTVLAQMLNPENSPQKRLELIQGYAQSAPDIAARVAAGFVLDFPEFVESLRPVIVQGVDRLLPAQFSRQAAGHTIDALVLTLDVNNELEPAASDKLVHALSSDELLWLLRVLAAKRSVKLGVVASGVLSRGLVPWPRSVFIKILTQSDSDPTRPAQSLVSNAVNNPILPDVNIYNSWTSPLSTEALYAVILSSSDREIITAAIDGIGSKPNGAIVASEVIKALDKYNAPAYDYALIIGSLGLVDEIPDNLLKQAVGTIKSTQVMLAVAEVMLQYGTAPVVMAVLDTIGDDIHPQILLPLLGHPEPQVRIRVIPFVKQLSLASARAELKRMYEQEKDLQVREVYEQEIVP